MMNMRVRWSPSEANRRFGHDGDDEGEVICFLPNTEGRESALAVIVRTDDKKLLTVNINRLTIIENT